MHHQRSNVIVDWNVEAVASYLSVAFSNLGAMDAPSSSPEGRESRSAANSDRGASFRGTSRPSFNLGMALLEGPEKKYDRVKKTLRTKTKVKVRCCRRAMASRINE